MSEKYTFEKTRGGERLVRIGQNGRMVPVESSPKRDMTPDEIEAAARTDPENPPIEQKRLRPIARVKSLRRALALTQEEFATRYAIPLETLQDWEQGRTEPDPPARAYLRVIAHDPDGVRRALATEKQPA